ncbi:MAG: hypothetical protein WCG82_01385, partial [Bacteroidota bacterium]
GGKSKGCAPVLLFVQKKRTKEKGAGNDKFWPSVRLLRKPCWRYRPAKISRHFRFAIAPLKNLSCLMEKNHIIHKIL